MAGPSSLVVCVQRHVFSAVRSLSWSLRLHMMTFFWRFGNFNISPGSLGQARQHYGCIPMNVMDTSYQMHYSPPMKSKIVDAHSTVLSIRSHMDYGHKTVSILFVHSAVDFAPSYKDRLIAILEPIGRRRSGGFCLAEGPRHTNDGGRIISIDSRRLCIHCRHDLWGSGCPFARLSSALYGEARELLR